MVFKRLLYNISADVTPKIYIKEKNFTRDDAAELAEVLGENTSITSIVFLQCNFAENGLSLILKKLKKLPVVRYISFQRSDLSKIEEDALAELVKCSKSLKIINLSDTKIPKNALIQLTAALKDNDSISELYLSNCSSINDAILKNLILMSSIKSLSLNNCRLEDSGIQSIASCLRESTKLIELHVDFNGITKVGVKALCESLSKNNSLKTLSLLGNQIEFEGAKALASLLKQNKTICSLHITDTNISSDGELEILGALRNNTTLTDLSYYTGEIQNKNVGQIYRLIERNRKGMPSVTTPVVDDPDKKIDLFNFETDELPEEADKKYPSTPVLFSVRSIKLENLKRKWQKCNFI